MGASTIARKNRKRKYWEWQKAHAKIGKDRLGVYNMEPSLALKYTALILTILIVFGIYPAILYNWILRLEFWLFYLILIGLDLYCIRLLKSKNRRTQDETKK